MKIQGKFIGVKEKTNVFVAEKTFTAHAGEKAVLKATALGLYCAHLNGVRLQWAKVGIAAVLLGNSDGIFTENRLPSA